MTWKCDTPARCERKARDLGSYTLALLHYPTQAAPVTVVRMAARDAAHYAICYMRKIGTYPLSV